MSEHPLDRTLLLLQLDAFNQLDRTSAIETIQTTRVKLTADETTMQSQGGQTALVACFVALSQMGLRITLEAPDLPLLGPQPPLIGDTIRTALLRHAGDLIQPCADDQNHHMTVALGRPRVNQTHIE